MKFPKLTKNAEYALLLEYKSTKSKHLKDILVMHALKFVMPFICKFHYEIRDELINEAVVEICRALEIVQPRESCRFSNYAYSFVRGTLCRIVSELNNSLECSNLLYYDDSDKCELLADLKYDLENLDLYEAISLLSEEDQRIVFDLYFKGYSKLEYGRVYGLNRSYTGNTLISKEKEILSILREKMT